MRFAHLRVEGQTTPRLAAVIAESAIFLDEIMGPAPRDLQDLIEGGPDALAEVRAAVDAALARGAEPTAIADLRHSSAVLRPAQVIAIGANYAAHSSELKLRSETAMTIFSLWPNSLTGHGATTTWPEDLSTQVDYEAELGVIIGRPARGVHVRDALDYVWGYTVVNDITARNIQFSEAQWSRCKSFDGFTPTGPVVVTADEVADPQDLWLTTNLDGHILQDASTNEMVAVGRRDHLATSRGRRRSRRAPSSRPAAPAAPATRATRRCSFATARPSPCRSRASARSRPTAASSDARTRDARVSSLGPTRSARPAGR